MKLSAQFSAVCFLGLICAAAAVPASADTLYDNSNANSYQINGLGIYDGLGLADSFTLATSATISQVSFGDWIGAGDTLTSVGWAITTDGFSGSTLASGTATSFSTTVENSSPSLGGWEAYSSTFSIPSLSLSAGTYYLVLDDGVDAWNYAVFWDVDYGSSSAQFYEAGPPTTFGPADDSETFAIYGSPNDVPSPTPEPSSLFLLGTGLAGLGGLIKRRFAA